MSKTKVAVYIRMDDGSVDEAAQTSFDFLTQYYAGHIRTNPDWEYAGVYIDHGSGTWPLEKRPELSALLCDCRKGKINLILTKNVSRLYRNIFECLRTVRELLELSPPVGIVFEDIQVNTLESCTISPLATLLLEQPNEVIININLLGAVFAKALGLVDHDAVNENTDDFS